MKKKKYIFSLRTLFFGTKYIYVTQLLDAKRNTVVQNAIKTSSKKKQMMCREMPLKRKWTAEVLWWSKQWEPRACVSSP